MVSKKLTAILLSLSAAGLVGACSHKSKHDDKKEPTAQEQANTQLDSQKEAFLVRVQSRIDEMTKNAADMRTRAAAMPKNNQKKVQNAADDLESLLKDARTSMESVRSADATHWVDYKRDVDSAMGKAESQYSNSLLLLR